MTRAHPAEGTLQALLDSELRPWTAFRLRFHLRRCADCRRALDEIRVRDDTIASLLRGAAPEIDAEDAWARFVVRSGGRANRRATSRGAWSAAIVVSAMIAVLALLTPDTGEPDAGELLAMVSAAREGHGEVVRDACCEDHDGGAYADDGLLTLNLPGERVAVVVIYEDVDGSGTFTPGDIVRYVSKTPRRNLFTRYEK
jgi:hypothetical protein